MSKSCALAVKGKPPIDFINPNAVAPGIIDALTKRTTSVYGCVQLPGPNGSKWWCAIQAASSEKESLGRDAGCASVNVNETLCMTAAANAWTDQVVSMSTGLPSAILVKGCLEDTQGFACTPSYLPRNSCTPKEGT
jgi:hypothetical protein